MTMIVSSSKRRVPLRVRLVAMLLVPLQLLPVCQMPRLMAEDLPAKAAAPAGVAGKLPLSTAPVVKVNRTVPQVATEVPALSFSAKPQDAEFATARLFAEPMLPMGRGKSTPEENRALAAALSEFATNPEPEHTAP